jgi:hypothetical protein
MGVVDGVAFFSAYENVEMHKICGNLSLIKSGASMFKFSLAKGAQEPMVQNRESNDRLKNLGPEMYFIGWSL